MGRRSRERERAAAAPVAEGGGTPRPGGGTPRPGTAPKPSRSEQRNIEAREALEPLDGQRPLAVTIGAIVCVVFAASNVALWAAGVHVDGTKATSFGVISFAAIMLIAAGGMWRSKYWAVLGFQALLALTVLIAAISLLVASNLAALALCLVTVLGGGALFWYLVKAMARIQMPERRQMR